METGKKRDYTEEIVAALMEGSISRPQAIPEDKPDVKTKREEEDLEREARRVEIIGSKQDLEQRKEYADRIFCLVKWWLVGIFVIIIAQGVGSKLGFNLSDKVLVTLIGGTTINVLGIFAIVANYIFYRPKSDNGKRK